MTMWKCFICVLTYYLYIYLLNYLICLKVKTLTMFRWVTSFRINLEFILKLHGRAAPAASNLSNNFKAIMNFFCINFSCWSLAESENVHSILKHKLLWYKIGNTFSKDSMISERNFSMPKLSPHIWRLIDYFGIVKIFISKQSFRRVMQRNDFTSFK